jgi:hypothetical protein
MTAPTLILTPQLAQAQEGKVIQGRGTGQLNCPSGSSPPGDEAIFFGADKFRGSILGDFFLQSQETGLSKEGTIFGGHISGKHFTLTGIESLDDLCSSQVPTTITITGQCGQGVPIQFRASNGEQGQFTGNVACAK